MLKVRVEFFGVPRERAGLAAMFVDVPVATLGSVLREVAVQLPNFANHCLDESHLKPGLIANVNGRKFISDSQTPLADGDSVLILSADVGG